MRTLPALLLTAMLLGAALLPAAAAGDDGPDDCDAGKERWDEAEQACVDLEEDEEDEPDVETCGEGEVLQGDECVDDPGSCASDEYYDDAKGECEEKDDLPEDCKDDEVYDATRFACEDDPTACDEDEVYDEAREDCVESPDSCDEDEVYDAAKGECEDAEDEVEIEEEHELEDDDLEEGGCEVRETESRHEEDYPNGTRYEERSRLRVLDCPGEERDRVLKEETKVRWKIASSSPGPASRVVIERVRDEVRVDVDLPSSEEDALEMSENASVLKLKGKADSRAAEVAFLEVLEFEDLNGNGAFDLDDRVLNAWRVADLATEAEDENGTLTVTYALPPGGTLAFVYHSVDASRAKFDIVIRGFEYGSDTSRVALRAAFTADNAAYHAERPDPALVAEVGGRLAVFDWRDDVMADGVEHPVIATVYVGGAAAKGTAQLYLAYPRGDDIVHDPSIGFVAIQSVAVVKEALLHPAAYGAAALVGAVFVVAGLVARKRN